jgi:filamentous hemagglutinin family protein
MKKSTHVKIRARMAQFLVFTMILSPLNTWANPQDGTVAGGKATIVQTSPTRLDVVQTTDRAIINWQKFNIGAGEHTNFQQPSPSSIILNRVLGADPSSILGKMTANGRVVLVNPNGIFFGKDARVDVAALIASTHDIRNDDFMAGRLNFTIPGKPGARIINQGTITVKDGGLVALVAPSMVNSGVIAARLGKVLLAAGNAATIDLYGDDLILFEASSKITEQIKDVTGVPLSSLIDNSGNILADGGWVLLTADVAKGVVDKAINMTGIIQAQTVDTKNGQIVLNGGEGNIAVSGILDASAPSGGNGGFLETSGAYVTIDSDARITTDAPFGKTGIWLIDPNDFTIAASGGNITGATLAGQLASNNVTIQTATQGTPGGNGDIFVNNAVSWSSANTLSLEAERNINLNNLITAYAGAVNLKATTNVNINADIIAKVRTVSAGNDIVVSSPLTGPETGSYGNTTMQAGRSILVNANITSPHAYYATANSTWNAGVGRAAGAGGFIMAPGTKITTRCYQGLGMSLSDMGIAVSTQGVAGPATLYNLSSDRNVSVTADDFSFAGGANSVWAYYEISLSPKSSKPVIIGGTGTAADFVIKQSDITAIKTPFFSLSLGGGTLGTTVNSLTFNDGGMMGNGQIYISNSGTVTLAGNLDTRSKPIQISTPNFVQNAGATLSAGTNSITLQADNVALNGSNGPFTAGSMSIWPQSGGRPLLIGASGTGAELALSTSELSILGSGVGGLTFGRWQGGGNVTIYSANFSVPASFPTDGPIGTLTIADNSTINTNGNSINFGYKDNFIQGAGSVINAGAGSISIGGNHIDLRGNPGSIIGGGTLSLNSWNYNSARPFVLGAAGTASDFALSNSEIATFAKGFSQITFGSYVNWYSDGATINAVTFHDPVRFYGSGGTINVNGPLAVGGLATFTDKTNIFGNISATGGLSFNADTTISTPVVLNGGTGTTNFLSTVNAGNNALSIFFKDIINNGVITTAGSLSFNASSSITLNNKILASGGTAKNIALAADNDININGTITMNNPSGNGGNLSMATGRSITINANITTDNGNLNLIANDTNTNGVVQANREVGAANITNNAILNAGTGNINFTIRSAKSTGRSGGKETPGTITKGTTIAASVVLNQGLTAAQQTTYDTYINASDTTLFNAILAGYLINSPSDPVWNGMYQNGSATAVQIEANRLANLYTSYGSTSNASLAQLYLGGGFAGSNAPVWNALLANRGAGLSSALSAAQSAAETPAPTPTPTPAPNNPCSGNQCNPPLPPLPPVIEAPHDGTGAGNTTPETPPTIPLPQPAPTGSYIPITRQQAVNVLPYAELAAAAYNPTTTTPGWSLLLADDQRGWSGFGASAHYNRAENKVVISFRGTGLSQLGDLLSDAGVLTGLSITQDQFMQATSFYNDVFSMLGGSFNNPTIVITGHSLGGALAQYVGATTGKETYAFNSAAVPASVILSNNISSSNNNIHVIRSTLDPVSLGGEATGALHLTNDIVNVDSAGIHGIGALITGIQNRAN